MKTCALCKDRIADKKNTHFLTDSSIRSTLDSDGRNRREYGLYYKIETRGPSIETKFQRNTSPEKIVEKLGRQPTESDIQNAMKNDFAVDYVFCTQCEKRFSEIEDKFFVTIASELINRAQGDIEIVEIQDSRLLRLYMYIQIWRSFICDQDLYLTENTSENLRRIIINDDEFSDDIIKCYPLSVTFLKTDGDVQSTTSNLVTFYSNSKPVVIFLNDLVIQFYDDTDEIEDFDCYNLKSYVNIEEELFSISVMSNNERVKLVTSIIEANSENTVEYIKFAFNTCWKALYHRSPTSDEFRDYSNYLQSFKGPGVNWLSREIVHESLKNYFNP